MRRNLIILNALAIFFFVASWFILGFELNADVMFESSDSKSYLELANWLFHGGETDSTAIRPVLYPVLLGIFYSVFGSFGVWLMQFACWLLTLNLTFVGVTKWSQNAKVGWIASMVMMVNLSLLAHTFQGLTEVVTTALLSVLFFHVVNYWKRYNQPQFGVKLLLIFVALTLVKPVFYYPTLLCLIAVFVAYRKVYFSAPKRLIFPLLVIVPLFFQMTLVQWRHGSFQVSQIAGITFENYYFAQCVRSIEGVEDEQESKEFVAGLSSNERKDYMLLHKGTFVKQFAENVVLNIKGAPDLLTDRYIKRFNGAYTFMEFYNLGALIVNVLGTFVLIFVFLKAFFKRNKDRWVPLFIIGGLLSYFLFTTGLSFWQGDRLTLPAVALWIPLYAVLFYRLGLHLLSKRK